MVSVVLVAAWGSDWSIWSKGRQPNGTRAALTKWTEWTLPVAVHCYNDSTINIVTAITITITTVFNLKFDCFAMHDLLVNIGLISCSCVMHDVHVIKITTLISMVYCISWGLFLYLQHMLWKLIYYNSDFAFQTIRIITLRLGFAVIWQVYLGP